MRVLACLALLFVLPGVVPAAPVPDEVRGAGAAPALVLVLALPQHVPPELQLPSARLVADTILLQFPGGQVTVVVEQPAGLAAGEELLAGVKQRARQLQATMVLWFTTRPPTADCAAPRRLQVSLLDMATGDVSVRLLCPAGVGAADIAQVVALAAAGALRRLMVTGEGGRGQALERLLPRRSLSAAPAHRRRCPPCPRQKCPPRRVGDGTGCRPCPAPTLPPRKRERFRLAAGFATATHPRPSAATFGVGVEFSLQLLDWLELGVGIMGASSRHLEALEVRALYHNWPLAAWLRGCFGSASVKGLVDAGLVIDLVNLEALLERFSESVTVSRVDPALRFRAGIRWWMTRSVGAELLAGTSIYLRTQRINYLYLGLPVEVLDMERVSFEGILALLVAFD